MVLLPRVEKSIMAGCHASVTGIIYPESHLASYRPYILDMGLQFC